MADDDEWRFSVEEVGDDAETDESTASEESDEWGVTIGEDDDGPTVVVGDADADGENGDGGNVAGTLTPEVPVERGTPDLENAAVVTAGVLVTVLVIGRLFDPGLTVLAAVGFAIVATAALLYLFFTRV